MSRCKQKYLFIDVYRMYGCSPVMPRSCWDEKWTKDDMNMDLLRGLRSSVAELHGIRKGTVF
jgi:hypothetical protein